jgi:hypothetical protein
MRNLAFASALCFALGASPALAQSDRVCELLASRVFDRYEFNGAWANLNTIKQAYCNERANTFERARTLDFNGTVPIDGVMAEFGFGASENGYQDFRSKLCSSKDELYSAQGWASVKVSAASQAILATLEKCVPERFAMRVTGINRQDPAFTWSFSNSLPMEKPTQKVKLNVPTGARCTDENGNLVRTGTEYKVGPNGLTLKCERRSCGSFQLSVAKASYAISPQSIEVPGYTSPPAPPQPVVNTVTVPPIGMNQQFSIDLKAHNPAISDGDSCTLVSAVGQWSCHRNDWSPTCAHSCDPNVAGGAPVLQVIGTTAHSGSYDIDYSDNNGTCTYRFACTKPVVVAAAPPIPAFCKAFESQRRVALKN